MVAMPSAIIFINNDLVPQVKQYIITQLHINEAIDGYVFDDRVAANPNYPTLIKSLNLRLMVIRPFNDYTNRELADVAVFAKNGMLSVEKNNFGPPIRQMKIADVYWGKFCIFKTKF